MNRLSKPAASKPSRARKQATTMSLGASLTYRLAIVAEAVSREVSKVYQEKFDLKRDEWRVLALLGEVGAIKTRDARHSTTLDKVQLSRAVNSLQAKKLLVRNELPEDRRNHVIELTGNGVDLYQRVFPEVLAVEAAIVSSIDKVKLACLTDALEQLLTQVTPTPD